ncbi:MAG: hypothetical protein ORN53_08815, partial [Crocinitomicaceae bacterium]|nr:hypothetical protein [Crocinitomicaceae bacterium]
MRFLILIILLCLHLSTLAQFKESDFHCRRDSIISQTTYGSVYLTKDHQCELYAWLCPNPNEWMKAEEIVENFSELSDACSPKISIGNIPRYWNSLQEYKGQYYVYGPSDWMSNRPEFISDSFLIEIASDFAYFSIIKQALVSPHELYLTLDLYGEAAQLRIRMLTYPKGAALWEYSIKSESWSELKISSEFVREYDLINNDCVNQKCFQEFHFD